jgi:hypothetical protein
VQIQRICFILSLSLWERWLVKSRRGRHRRILNGEIANEKEKLLKKAAKII